MRTVAFLVDITGIGQTANHISQVHGLHVSFGKTLAPPSGPRHQFVPGAPQFDDISIEMTLTGTTDQDFDHWVHDISNGLTDNRSGVIHAYDASFSTVVQDIGLIDLSPVAFPTIASNNRRTIVLSLVRFEFQ